MANIAPFFLVIGILGRCYLVQEESDWLERDALDERIE
jgi:hypothetical protein